MNNLVKSVLKHLHILYSMQVYAELIILPSYVPCHESLATLMPLLLSIIIPNDTSSQANLLTFNVIMHTATYHSIKY